MAEFNGHKDWDHWNVALWLSNDESLYRNCMAAIKNHSSIDSAAAYLMTYVLPEKTADGASYTHERVRATLRGLED